jgi:hypothetical protein
MSKIFENNHVIIEESDIKNITYDTYDWYVEDLNRPTDDGDYGFIVEKVMDELNYLTCEFEEGTDGHYKKVEDWDELNRIIEDYVQEVINNRG